MHRFFGFLRRIFRGEDVLLISQASEEWERQFAAHSWDRLQEGQANTVEIARRILADARTKGDRIRVLDIGCGNGGLARLIAHSVDYTGIDVAPSAIASAREVAPEGTFIIGDATHPPQDLGVFDVLVFNEVLYYMNPSMLLPRYKGYGNSHARVYVSVVRFWRSWFLWRRIALQLRLTERAVVSDATHRWDIAAGHFL